MSNKRCHCRRVCVLFNVLQQGGAGVHYRLEGVFASRGHAFIWVQ